MSQKDNKLSGHVLFTTKISKIAILHMASKKKRPGPFFFVSVTEPYLDMQIVYLESRYLEQSNLGFFGH